MDKRLTWVLFASTSKARIFSFHKAKLFIESHPKNLELVGTYSHVESREKNKDLVTDKWGSFNSNTFYDATQPKIHEAEIFALDLIEKLEVARKENLFREIIIFAPANFIGILNKHMHSALKKLVIKELEKDYTQHDLKQLIIDLLQHL